jgi:hypothetical protein
MASFPSWPWNQSMVGDLHVQIKRISQQKGSADEVHGGGSEKVKV